MRKKTKGDTHHEDKTSQTQQGHRLAGTLFGGHISAQEVLPTPPAPFKWQIGLSAKDSKSDFPKQVQAPKGAPNIVLVLLDDVGFGASSAFGDRSPRRLSNGWRRTVCGILSSIPPLLSSPTRAALLTGRNHHSVHTDTIMETATGLLENGLPASYVMDAVQGPLVIKLDEK